MKEMIQDEKLANRVYDQIMAIPKPKNPFGVLHLILIPQEEVRSLVYRSSPYDEIQHVIDENRLNALKEEQACNTPIMGNNQYRILTMRLDDLMRAGKAFALPFTLVDKKEKRAEKERLMQIAKELF